jgi:hypothetical protein
VWWVRKTNNPLNLAFRAGDGDEEEGAVMRNVRELSISRFERWRVAWWSEAEITERLRGGSEGEGLTPACVCSWILKSCT